MCHIHLLSLLHNLSCTCIMYLHLSCIYVRMNVLHTMYSYGTVGPGGLQLPKHSFKGMQFPLNSQGRHLNSNSNSLISPHCNHNLANLSSHVPHLYTHTCNVHTMHYCTYVCTQVWLSTHCTAALYRSMVN